MFIYTFINVSYHLFVCQQSNSQTIQLSISPSAHLTNCLTVKLPINTFVNLSISLSVSAVHLSICLSIHLSVCLSANLSICSSVHLYIFISVHLPNSQIGHLPTLHLSNSPSVCLSACSSISHSFICPSVHFSWDLSIKLSILRYPT